VTAENPDLGKVAKKEAVRKYIMSSEENLNRTMEDILEELYGERRKAGTWHGRLQLTRRQPSEGTGLQEAPSRR
jgi:hypothetical protein